ncbi:craniofacial development protein 1 [Panulirus ornatus]|uniref:craniofacial development protein 1 n=1 Tax=Panulirus ornatus TaxID=150431 RepID=UPI003A847172
MLQDEDYDSDTSDEDFVPEGVESEDEPLIGIDDESDEVEHDDEGNLTKKGKKRKKNRKGKRQSSLPFGKLSDQTGEEQKDEQVVNEQDKKKADDIWADFLADVEDKPSPPPKPKSSSWATLLGNKKPSSSNTVTSKVQEPTGGNLIKKDGDATKRSTVKITQVYEFAGEEVRVEKELDVSSPEAKAALASPSPDTSEGRASTPGVGGLKRPGGLSGIVGILDSKKQKLTTLEKTKLDWNNFKAEEGIDEDLERHKKSKHG